MDLVEASRAFLYVAERRSFTRGAQVAGLSQPVASRRVAALERRLGVRLLDRTGRRPTVTRAGQRLLPEIRRLIESADAITSIVDTERAEPVELLVPTHWDLRLTADLCLAGHHAGVEVLLTPATPDERHAALDTRPAVAVLTEGGEGAAWRVPLGLATAVAGPRTARVDQLRPPRRASSQDRPHLWLLGEDDVPHVRDTVELRALSAGLAASQVRVSRHLAQSVAAVLSSHDRLLCSAGEADRLGLAWAPLAPALVRGHRLAGSHDRTDDVVPALAAALDLELGVA